MAILSNQSFVTDRLVYNSSKEEVYPLTEEPVDEEYFAECLLHVKNHFTVSAAIAAQDYYAKVVPADYIGRVWKDR